MLVAEKMYGMVVNVPDEDITIHKEKLCAGRNCVFHNPSDHHMKEWKMVLRLDKEAIVERMCPHGIGHPDPDSMNFFSSIGKDYLGVHGCDGCCDKA